MRRRARPAWRFAGRRGAGLAVARGVARTIPHGRASRCRRRWCGEGCPPTRCHVRAAGWVRMLFAWCATARPCRGDWGCRGAGRIAGEWLIGRHAGAVERRWGPPFGWSSCRSWWAQSARIVARRSLGPPERELDRAAEGGAGGRRLRACRREWRRGPSSRR